MMIGQGYMVSAGRYSRVTRPTIVTGPEEHMASGKLQSPALIPRDDDRQPFSILGPIRKFYVFQHLARRTACQRHLGERPHVGPPTCEGIVCQYCHLPGRGDRQQPGRPNAKRTRFETSELIAEKFERLPIPRCGINNGSTIRRESCALYGAAAVG